MKEDTLKMLHQVCGDLAAVAGLIRRDTQEVEANGSHVDVIRHYNHVRIAAEQIKEAREAINDINDALSRDMVPTFMRNAGIKTITVEGVGRVTITNRFSCSMLDKQLGFKWLRERGHGGLIQETVNSSTLAAFAKNLIEDEGKELPDDIFKVGTQTYTSITKVK